MAHEGPTNGDRAIADYLRSLRLQAGISQQELANKLNETQSFISKYENAQRKLTMIEFIGIANALGQDAAIAVHYIERRLHP